MTTVTADDIRILARAPEAGAALARVGDDIQVVPDDNGPGVVYTKARLVEEYGEEITDVDAEVLAAGLTARLTEDRQRPDTDVSPEAGAVEPPD
jgi:hypothetical protein